MKARHLLILFSVLSIIAFGCSPDRAALRPENPEAARSAGATRPADYGIGKRGRLADEEATSAEAPAGEKDAVDEVTVPPAAAAIQEEETPETTSPAVVVVEETEAPEAASTIKATDGIRCDPKWEEKLSKAKAEAPPESGDVRVFRSYESIYMRMKKYAPGMKFSYRKLLRLHPKARGKLVVTFTILPDGKVVRAGIRKSSFSAYPEFEKEILKKIRKITFPSIEPSKGKVTVDYPFVFFQGE